MTNPRYQKEKHTKIMNQFTTDEHKHRLYKTKKVQKFVSYRIDDGIKLFEKNQEIVSSGGCIIYPEFVEYIFTIEGCPKKLLLYLMFHHVDGLTNRFVFNDQVIYEFQSYCMLKEEKSHSYTNYVVKVAIRTLVRSNVILNIKRRQYMMNPMIIGGSSENRRRLIIEYSSLLLKKNNNCDRNFYPK